jgi:hypothetical protein
MTGQSVRNLQRHLHRSRASGCASGLKTTTRSFAVAHARLRYGRRSAASPARPSLSPIWRAWLKRILHVLVHEVDATAADRIVRVVLQQPAPRHVEKTLRRLDAPSARCANALNGSAHWQSKRLTFGVGLLDPDAAGERRPGSATAGHRRRGPGRAVRPSTTAAMRAALRQRLGQVGVEAAVHNLEVLVACRRTPSWRHRPPGPTPRGHRRRKSRIGSTSVCSAS